MSNCLCGYCDKCKARIKAAMKVMRDAEEFAKKYDCSPLAYFKFVSKAQIDGEEP